MANYIGPSDSNVRQMMAEIRRGNPLYAIFKRISAKQKIRQQPFFGKELAENSCSVVRVRMKKINEK